MEAITERSQGTLHPLASSVSWKNAASLTGDCIIPKIPREGKGTRVQKRGSKKRGLVSRKQLAATASKIGMGAAFEVKWKDAPDELLWWIIKNNTKPFLLDMARLELRFREFLVLYRLRQDRQELVEMSQQIRREERRLRRKVKQHLSTAISPERQRELIERLRSDPRF